MLQFMGYEMEWDSREYSRLYDTDFSFETGTAQKRLVEYQDICFQYDVIENSLYPEQVPSLFEMLGYSLHSAYEMNRKFLYAQANHETGNVAYAYQANQAVRELERLLERYNTQLDGKWNRMISEITPGYTALYQNLPEYVEEPTTRFRLPDNQRHPEFEHKIDLQELPVSGPFRMLDGIGTDWKALQMGQPMDFDAKGSIEIPIPSDFISEGAGSISVCISVVPLWPVAYDRSNCIGVSVDGSEPVICENKFQEWGREWKIQVLENRKEYVLSFPLDSRLDKHSITLSIVDPGQIVQKITVR